MRKHVFFLVRYSVLASRQRGWKLARRERDDYRRQLFSSERLELRAWLFANLAAPSIVRNSRIAGVSSSTLIFTSTELPDSARTRLDAIARTIPNSRVIPLDEGCAYPAAAAENVIRNILDTFGEETVYATVQIDDDDLLSPAFMESIRHYLDRPFCGHVVSCARGYIGEIDLSTRAFFQFRHFYSPNAMIGLSYINAYDPATRKFQDPDAASGFSLGTHVAVDERRPVIVSAATPCWIRTFHEENDLFSDHGRPDRERYWYKSLAKASVSDVMEVFSDYAIPLSEHADRNNGVEVSGRLRGQSRQSALLRLRNESVGTRLLRRISGLLRSRDD